MNLHFGRKPALVVAGIAVAMLLGWLVTNQGPLGPAKVTVAKVAGGGLVASTFGIGTVEARRSYALGPTVASRVLRVLVDQGDAVKGGSSWPSSIRRCADSQERQPVFGPIFSLTKGWTNR